jgi:hypothetical protein
MMFRDNCIYGSENPAQADLRSGMDLPQKKIFFCICINRRRHFLWRRGVGALNYRSGTTWVPKGKTALFVTAGSHFKVNVISLLILGESAVHGNRNNLNAQLFACRCTVLHTVDKTSVLCSAGFVSETKEKQRLFT